MIIPSSLNSPEDKLTVLLEYMDDIIISGDDVDEKLLLKEKLAMEFETKDVGRAKYFLQIEVAYSK